MKNRQDVDLTEEIETDAELFDDEIPAEEPETQENKESTIENDDNYSEEDSQEEESEDNLVIEIEGESPSQTEESKQPAPLWVKDLRKKTRELQKQNRELQQKLNSSQVSSPTQIELGKKPTLEECDYDSEKFEGELATWFDRKRKIDEQKIHAQKAEEETQKRWESELTRYNEAKTKIKINDFEDAEETVKDKLSAIQQAIIISGAENAAYVMYALGKNQKKLDELAGISDPIKFACSITRLETKLKITNKKAPAPEQRPRSSANGVITTNGTLARLESEALKTGDRTKILQYKRKLREAEAKRA